MISPIFVYIFALPFPFNRADLLKDVNEAQSTESLCAEIASVDPSVSVREVIDRALYKDESLKKLRVVQVFQSSIR